MKQLNARIADVLSNWLATMTTFWILTIMIVVATALSPPADLQGWLLVLISVFFQGVALPVLCYSGVKSGTKTDKLLRESHDAIFEALFLAKKEQAQILQDHRQEMAELKTLVRLVHEEIKEHRKEAAG